MLDLEQLQKLGPLVRGDHHLEAAVRIGQHQPRSLNLQHVNAPSGEHAQQLVHVELAHHGLDEFRKRLSEPLQLPRGTTIGAHSPTASSRDGIPRGAARMPSHTGNDTTLAGNARRTLGPSSLRPADGLHPGKDQLIARVEVGGYHPIQGQVRSRR